jgi:hypothetical protein
MKQLFSTTRGLVCALMIGMLIVACEPSAGVSPLSTPTSIGVLSPLVTPTAIYLLPASPTAPPINYVPRYTGTPPTSTPRVGEIRPTVKSSTPTPLPISRTIDLAKELPDKEKYVIVVQHPDGTYEKYLIPLDRWQDRTQLIGLGPQDTIIYSGPLVPMSKATPPVTVLNPSQLLDYLATAVKAYIAEGSIPNSIGTVLTTKLQNAQQSLARGQADAVVNELKSFIDTTQENQRKNQIGGGISEDLIMQAQFIIAQVQNATPSPTR